MTAVTGVIAVSAVIAGIVWLGPSGPLRTVAKGAVPPVTSVLAVTAVTLPIVTPQGRARAGDAVRRSETFTIPIASCLQGTILAPTPARPPRPAAWLTAIRHFG